MEKNKVLQVIKTVKKGTFVKIVYNGNTHALKNGRDKGIEKICYGVYRIGIKYSNLKQNADKETQPLNGKTWEKSLENYLLTSDKTNEEMLRVYTTKHKTKSQWLINGLETTKEELISLGYISSAVNHNEVACFDIKLANIISIG